MNARWRADFKNLGSNPSEKQALLLAGRETVTKNREKNKKISESKRSALKTSLHRSVIRTSPKSYLKAANDDDDRRWFCGRHEKCSNVESSNGKFPRSYKTRDSDQPNLTILF